MKTAFILIPFLTIILQDEALKMTTESYNLKGNVEILSEKKIPVKINENGEIGIDSSMIFVTRITNRHFDKNGFIREIRYFDSDSSLRLHSKVITNESGKYLGSNEYGPNNKLHSKSKVVKSSSTFLMVESRNPNSDQVVQKSTTEYSKGLVTKQASEFYQDGKKNSRTVKYKRDESGNETVIKESSNYDGETSSRTYLVNYINYDAKGNWIKRTVCNQDKNNECLLITRTIEYYD